MVTRAHPTLMSRSARVAELEDAEDSKSFDLAVVWVRVPPRALGAVVLREAPEAAGRSDAQFLSDSERQIQRLTTVEAGVAHRLVTHRQIGVAEILRATEALGDIVAG